MLCSMLRIPTKVRAMWVLKSRNSPMSLTSALAAVVYAQVLVQSPRFQTLGFNMKDSTINFQAVFIQHNVSFKTSQVATLLYFRIG